MYERYVCICWCTYIIISACVAACRYACVCTCVCMQIMYYFWLPLGASASAVPGRSYRFNLYTSPLTKLDQFKPKIDLIERGPNEY